MAMKSLIVCLMLAGCYQSYNEVTPVGDTFEGTWKEEIAQAAKEWTDVGCLVSVVDDGVPVILSGTDDREWEDHIWGYYRYDDGGTIFIRDSLTPYNRHKILLHEMGHMLGYDHRDWGIMKAKVSQNYVTAEDCQ